MAENLQNVFSPLDVPKASSIQSRSCNQQNPEKLREDIAGTNRKTSASMNWPLSCWTWIYSAFANSVDPDQLASEEANWSESELP